jgi:hypothetical protein
LELRGSRRSRQQSHKSRGRGNRRSACTNGLDAFAVYC